MAILLLFAFVSGLVTIAAPCIWPLLPIVLSSSALGQDHRRPLGLTLGILISFGFLTLSLSYILSVLRFDTNILRFASAAILIFLGLTLVLSPLARLLESAVSRITGNVGFVGTSGGFWAGFTSGLALGIVWAPCAGPILATIATLAATRAVSVQIILVTVFYLVGIGIPLFIFAYLGQRIFAKSRLFSRYTPLVQKVFGVVIILTAILIFSNYDKVIEARMLNFFPSYSNFLNSFEGNETVKKELNVLRGGLEPKDVGKSLSPMNERKTDDLLNSNYPSPELTGVTNWLNLPNGEKSLSIRDLRGKVVLVDFWTYTCINCIRTLPFVTSWYNKYHDMGFVVLGVHTPEFEFEKSSDNVANAIKQYGILYPVPQDNNYATWNSFNNVYWPAEYLIDKEGNVRRTHFGEGEYDKMEQAIQKLLAESGQKVPQKLSDMPDETPRGQISPETYLGAQRMEYFFPNGTVSAGSYTNLRTASGIPVNSFTLGGSWAIYEQYAVAGLNGVLEYNFSAKKVFLVVRPDKDTPSSIRVFIDGEQIDEKAAGKDVSDGVVNIDSDRLYELVNLTKNENHLLRLEFSPGVSIFAFTFG